MMRIKKVVAILLCGIMMLCLIPFSMTVNMQSCAVENNEPTKYVLPIQKNGIETIEIEVYECNGKYYTVPQNIANLTRTEYINAEVDPIYGGKSFIFQQGIFEVSVDVENQKMYSCLTEYTSSIREVLESKIDLANRYLNLDEPIRNFTELKEIVTDDMIEQLNLPAPTIDDYMNEPSISLEKYALDNTDVSVVNIDSQYMIELIPWLRYMGAECKLIDNCLEVSMPYRTLWESIMPDLHDNTHNKVETERSTAHNAWDVSVSVVVDVISDVPGFFKYMLTDTWKDVTGQQSGDKYVEEAIYDILQVDYSKSLQVNEKVNTINDYVDFSNSDVIDTANSIFEFAYEDYNSYLPYLTNNISPDKYKKLCDRATKIDSLQKNTEVLNFVLCCAATINERLNYSDDAKQSLNSVLNKNIDDYVKDKSNSKWSDTARRIMKDLSSTESIVSDAIIDNSIDWLIDKGTEKGLGLFGKANYATLGFDLAKSILINDPMFKPVWEGYDAQLYMILQNDIQVDTLKLIDSLAETAISTKKCSDSNSLNDLVNALKFYYRAVIAHADNSVKYLEEVDLFNKNGDNLIREYKSLSEKTTEYLYNISNCTITPIQSYDTLKNDLITEEWMNAITKQNTENLFEILPEDFLFSSGVGAWGTSITIANDGTFVGNYHDSDMGDSNTSYPNGTVYSCSFKGEFSEPMPIDEYAYSLNTIAFEVENNIVSEYIENGIRYINSEPHGLENTNEFILYLPGCKLTNIQNEFDCPNINSMLSIGRETLPEGMYILYNKTCQSDFWGADKNSIWGTTYYYSYKSTRSRFTPMSDLVSRLTFWPNDNSPASLNICFNWTNDAQREFSATDSYGSKNYNYKILVDFSKEKDEVYIELVSLDGIDLTKYGGTSYGVLKATYTTNESYVTEDSPSSIDNNTSKDVETTTSSIPEIYLKNESSWLHESNNPFAVFWFQDLDFDGINEMICGFEVDQFSGNVFGIYENNVSENQFGITGQTAIDALDLCYDEKKQEYFYLNRTATGFGDEKSYYTIYKYQHMWMDSIVGYTVDNYVDGHKTYYGLHDSDNIYNSASISAEKYVEIYNEFVANLRYVDCTTEIIQVSDYIKASDEERLSLLQKSYNAFQIGNIKEHVPSISVSNIR